ncbi:MAG TPA: hypothetical protein VIV11_32470 [Kofleriaceae bacterium]
MTTRSGLRGWLACSMLLIGCTAGTTIGGDDDDDSGGGGAGTQPDAGTQGSADAGNADPIPFACPGGTIAPGMNTLVIGNTSRTFIADFPMDMSKPLGVLFSWHGYQQTAPAFRTEVALDPNANPNVPLVVITPNDTDLVPPFGLGWDIIEAAGNVDFVLFESIMGCLKQQYSIDPKAIYSFGFSAGSVMTSLIHSQYPKLVSTIVAESGAWFNDPAQRALVTIPLLAWQWPALIPGDGGTVLLTHGGPNDVTVANIMNLENAAQAAIPFLKMHDRVVADCSHTGGHVIDPNVRPNMIVSFVTSYRTGETASAMAGFGALPPSCRPSLP